MSIVDLETALATRGVRLVLPAGVPSPWSMAALAIFGFKKVPLVRCRATALDPAFQRWGGSRNFPAVLMDDEPVRTGWAEILALAERLAPEPSLLPSDARARVEVLGSSHEILDEGGLMWSARLMAIDAGLTSAGQEGFPARVARYLAPRYGWSKGCAEPARARATAVLARLDAELARHGGPYLAGETMTALDVYAASAMNALVPLPDVDCPLSPAYRASFSWMGRAMGDAVTAGLLAHRDRVVARCHALPLEL